MTLVGEHVRTQTTTFFSVSPSFVVSRITFDLGIGFERKEDLNHGEVAVPCCKQQGCPPANVLEINSGEPVTEVFYHLSIVAFCSPNKASLFAIIELKYKEPVNRQQLIKFSVIAELNCFEECSRVITLVGCVGKDYLIVD